MNDLALMIDSVVVEGAADWNTDDLRFHVERALQAAVAGAGWLEPGREPTHGEARETLSSSLTHALADTAPARGSGQ